MPVQERLGRLPAVGTALAVQRRYQADASEQLAAAIGFFGFLSLVPLLLLAVATAGFVWDDPERQVEIALAITSAVPGLDAALGEGETSAGATAFVEGVVARRATLGVVGLLLLVPTGLKVIASAMAATRVVFRGAVLTGVQARVRQVLALLGLGAIALLAAGASSLAAGLRGALPTGLALLVSVVLTFVLDLALFTGAYRLLSPSADLGWRQLLPGAALAAAGWAALKVVGATVVGTQADSANALYGAVGGIVALLLLLYLAGRLYLYGAQLSAVLVERRQGPLLPPEASPTRQAPTTGQERAMTDTAEDQPPGPPPVPRIAGAPRPRDPGPRRRADTVTADTDRRLEDAEVARRAAAAERGAVGETRTAIAFGLALAALGVAWRVLGPGRR